MSRRIARYIAPLFVFVPLSAIFSGCGETVTAAEKLDEDRPTFADDEDSVVEPPMLELNQCPSAECPEGRTSCPNSPYLCGVDLLSDDENCGACGVRCPTDTIMLNLMKGKFRCIKGECRLQCDSRYADCNGRAEDGCELNLQAQQNDDPNNCGECGNVCEEGICSNGYCGCAAGTELCNGQCTDTLTDNTNCGECGNACPPSPRFAANLRMLEWCASGQCNVRRCRDGYLDCDGDMADGALGNGCETNLLDPNNCFGCGNVCAPGEGCDLLSGGCVCPCGAICDKPERVLSDINNCGACGNRCPGDRRSLEGHGVDPAHGQPVCNTGVCGYECSPEWGDCDGDISNGCEASFLSDPLNCGGCGIRCDGVEGQACVDGRCLTEDCTVVR